MGLRSFLEGGSDSSLFDVELSFGADLGTYDRVALNIRFALCLMEVADNGPILIGGVFHNDAFVALIAQFLVVVDAVPKTEDLSVACPRIVVAKVPVEEIF